MSEATGCKVRETKAEKAARIIAEQQAVLDAEKAKEKAKEDEAMKHINKDFFLVSIALLKAGKISKADFLAQCKISLKQPFRLERMERVLNKVLADAKPAKTEPEKPIISGSENATSSTEKTTNN